MDETNVETGDNKEPLDRVSFTFAELKALKDLIVNPPTPPLAPAENQSF